MVRGRRRARPRRRRIFVGCEGESERAYAEMLRHFADREDLHVHIDSFVANGGDPLGIVQSCIAESERRELRRGEFAFKVIILDADRRRSDVNRGRELERLLGQIDFLVHWNDPCFEADLVRHFPNYTTYQVQDTAACEAQLERIWPEYVKPPTGQILAAKFTMEDIRRYCARHDSMQAVVLEIGLAA